MGSEDAAPSAEIFRAYDIRGVVGRTLTKTAVEQIGRAFAAEAQDAGHRQVVVGGDGRTSTGALRAALLRGLCGGGMRAIDIGCVPTPLVYYATHALGTGTGIMITGSHNPPEYNGLKMMIGGATLAGERIQALRRRIGRRAPNKPGGSVRDAALIDRYIEEVAADVAAERPLKVVADCGNGVAGLVAPRLLERIGCDVAPLYADVDGTFPNHHPDPAEPANLADLVAAVKAAKADLGVAFDGDGDRLGVVTERGAIVWPDRTMMLFAKDVLERNPGAGVVFDVKCSRHLPALIRACGGEPVMCRTGHSHIKAKIRERGALLGGEFSGHICFGERWYGFDDAIYSAARLVEILARAPGSAHDVFAQFPDAIATSEIKLPTTESAKFEAMARLAREGRFGDGVLNDIDGIRVDYEDGWGLVRPSNTSPALTLRFEADDAAALQRIQGIFDAALRGVDDALGFHPPAASAAQEAVAS